MDKKLKQILGAYLGAKCSFDSATGKGRVKTYLTGAVLDTIGPKENFKIHLRSTTKITAEEVMQLSAAICGTAYAVNANGTQYIVEDSDLDTVVVVSRSYSGVFDLGESYSEFSAKAVNFFRENYFCVDVALFQSANILMYDESGKLNW